MIPPRNFLAEKVEAEVTLLPVAIATAGGPMKWAESAAYHEAGGHGE